MGVSGVISKDAWDYIGGNDDRFAPMYWEDADIFIRMMNEGYEFKLTSKSVLYHFASRTSRFPDDNLNVRPPHLAAYEQRSLERFINKYGRLPIHGPYGEYLPMPIIDGSLNRI
jgi:GT2 family glycosyltransferase